MSNLADDRFDPVLRAPDNAEPLLDNDGLPITELDPDSSDALAEASATIAELAAGKRSWRYGHVIVDEAQDLTPMQWRMIGRRARGGSMTVVGDLAQRSIGEPGSWSDHLPESAGNFAYQELTINYRSPSEINAVASVVLEELAPELNAPRSIRASGHPPEVVALPDLGSSLHDLVTQTRAAHPVGRLAVIGAEGIERQKIEGVQWVTPWQSKGLEFDTVILVEPARILEAEYGLSLLYVALTRTTDRLTVAHRRDLPPLVAKALTA